MEEEEESHPSQDLLIEGEDEEDSRRTRVMANLRDSLLSELAESNPSLSRNASSIILHRVQKLFTPFKTPTHPPYALMIRRAITELNEENGSTAKAISYSIQKEYEGLPWAHESILGIQLGKLCENKELVCDKSGRYVLMVDGDGKGEETGECKGSRKKRKRGKRRNDHNVDVGGERKGKVAKRDEIVERGNELQEAGIKKLVLLHDSDSHRSDEPTREEVCAQENGEEALKHSIEKVEGQAKSEEMLIEVVGKRSQSKLQGSRFIERPAEAEAEALAAESQLQDSVLQSETTCSSNPTEMNAFADSQQPQLLPSSKCVPSAETELPPTQTELQISSSSDACGQKPVSGDPKQNHQKHLRRGRLPKAKPAADNQGDSSLLLRDVIVNALKHNVKKMKKQWPSRSQGRGIGRGRLRNQRRILKNKAISGGVNVDNDQQHGNQGNPKRNLSENPISGDPEQNPPKRPRGRPPKSKTVAICQGEPILSSDDGIPSKGRGRGRVSGRGRGRGTGRGRGRPPIRRDADHYEKQLQNEDQAMEHGRGRGRGRGGRGIRGRGSSGRGRGRPRKLDQSVNPSEEQSQPQDQAEGLSQEPLQLQSEAKQSQEQQGQGCDQNQDADQARPSNPVSDADGEPPAATHANM